MPNTGHLMKRIRNRLPRHTVRLRLTITYGALFLASGAALLGITYALVQHATGDPVCVTSKTSHSGTIACQTRIPDNLQAGPGQAQIMGGSAASAPAPLTEQQVRAQARQLQLQASHQRAAELNALLEQSGIALALMAILSIVLGWIVAGRVLRPLRTITSTARRLSASNLHERLALNGPDDELKELGDTFDALLERLEASFRSQRQFVANASHELRSPLARQRTLIQVALTDPDANIDTLRAAHQRVLAAGAQQERCIDALLALSRGQAGIDHRTTTDLATLADEAVLAHDGDASRAGITITTSLASAPISADVRLIERMLANLVDNAVRYNVPSGNVHIETDSRNGCTTCTVTNTGPMIPTDDVASLAEPFRRLGTDRTGHRNGLGLGLSIVKAIADAHNASLDLQPRTDGGLSVGIRFALANTTPPHAKTTNAAPALTPQPAA
jgi:signal transduction histidine kinase